MTELVAFKIAVVAFTLLVIEGMVILLVGRRIEPRQRRDWWARYRVQVIATVCLLSPAYFGGVLFWSFLVLMGARALYEWFATVGGIGRGVRWSAQLGALSLVTCILFAESAITIWTAALVVLAVLLFLPSKDRRGQAERYVQSLAYPIAPVCALAWLGSHEQHFAVIAVTFIVAETQDTVAYVIGRTFGKTRLTPKLSPGKTLEGFTVGGLIALGLAGWLFVAVLELPRGTGLLCSLAVVVGGVGGDLIASAIKRRHHVKDYPSLVPGYDGVLDTYDALLGAATCLAIVFWLVPLG